MDTAQIKRQKRLRRLMLQLIDAAKASGSLKGRTLADIVEDSPDWAAEGGDDRVMMALAADLAAAGLITCRDTRTHKSQREGLDYTAYTITAKGTALLAEAVPAEPLVEDERLA